MNGDIDKETVARLDGVTKMYGALTALDRVSLRIGRGEILAMLGPNGAGKTTAVRMLLGLSAPNDGEATVFGQSPREPRNRVRTGALLQVGRVPATLRVREHIDLFRAYYPNPLSMEEIVEAAGLAGLERQLFGTLSGGQQQRLLFALAICGDPEFLVLDEPTVGLDIEARRAMWEQIRRFVARGRSILLTTHYLEEADALASRIVVINRGKVVAEGSPNEIKARAAGKRIRCHTSIPPEDLKRIANVTSVRGDRDIVEILTSDAEGVLRHMLARDERVSSIEVMGAALEEAFLQITSQEPETIKEVA